MQKMTFFYHVNSAGYSESHLVPDQTGDAQYLAIAADYTTKRMAMSGAQTAVDWIRFSTIGSARQVRVYTPFDLPAGTPVFGTFRAPGGHGADQSDFGGTTILLRKIASNGNFSHWFFRGVPDEVVIQGGEYDAGSGWTNVLNTMATFMINNNFRWPTITKEAPPGHKISALANNGIGQVIFTFTDNPFNGMNPGTKLRLRITGQPTRPKLNGSWTVTVLDNNNAQTVQVEWLPTTPNATGFAFKIVSGTALIAKLSVERITERKVGRPFGLYRGKVGARGED